MRTILFILLLSFSSLVVTAETLVVRCPPPANDNDSRSLYYIELLHLALEKTRSSDGPFKVEIADLKMPQQRAIQSLIQGLHINVMWTMTTAKREQQLLPVRVPLLKGLLGHRIFIIRQEDQPFFRTIRTLRDLAKINAGQGLGWPDTDILQANQLPVITGSNYTGLFRMLRQGRFDYFPRGVHEPWDEVRTHANQGLAVESSILLQYPAPSFFFVNKSNPALQQRLSRGLHIALQDGSFDQLLYTSPAMQAVFQQSNMEHRSLFRLNNPLLSNETRALLTEPSYWYQPGDEQR